MFLVTGATGFLGKEIIRQLNSSKIVKLGRSVNSDIVFDFEKDNKIIADKYLSKINSIIHVAGFAHVFSKNEIVKNKMNKINVEGTLKLISYADKLKKLDKIIFISSVSVYGIECGIEINENFETKPKNFYGESKLKAEKIIIDWAKNKNVKFYILRLPLVVGENPPGNLGKMETAIKKNRFFIIDNGKAKKSMVMATDVGKLISNIEGKSGIYNLTDGHHPSFLEMSKLISKKFKSRNPISIPIGLALMASRFGTFIFGSRFPLNIDTLKKITSDLTFNDTKARKELKWKPKMVIKNY